MAKAKKSTSKASSSTAKVASQLVNVLSDTYVLAIKTHGYHWNVTGALFPQLHEQFSEQYEALFEAADDIAERIRALDVFSPGSMELFLQNSAIKEATVAPLSAAAMVKDLLKSHEVLRSRIIDASEVADEYDDDATEDLMTERLRYHDKVIWMLRSQTA